MSLDPDHPYDVLAINAASMSTQLSGLPFAGPIGATRVALIDGQWVAFPTPRAAGERHRSTWSSPGRLAGGRRRRDHDGRGRGHRPHRRLVGEGATGADRGDRRPGLEAAKPFIRDPVRARRPSWPRPPAKPIDGVPDLPRRTRTTSSPRSTAAVGRASSTETLTIAGKQEREADARPASRTAWSSEVGRAVRGPREGDRRGVPLADQEAGPPADPARPGPHRRPRRRRTSGRWPPRST